MSCFNCYSERKLDSDLIDKILERGQRLRSAMVQSILRHDPLNLDVINDQVKKPTKLDDLPHDSNSKIRAFLQGDPLSREEEIWALETLRSMSATDLCKVTDRTYRSEEPCDCLTCHEYREKDLNCDLKRVENSNEITEKIQQRYKNEFANYIKFVDSVKVSVNSVLLNEAGDKKVLNSLIKDKASSVGQNFFLEYQIPEILVRNSPKNKSKVDSGLDSGNLVRLCTRRSHQVVNFKQTSIHDIENLSRVKLEDAIITFRLSFRNFKQKQPITLGVAHFNFSSFQVSKNFTCNQELTLRLQGNAPIVVGGLKISVQLGCGRLYFGKEFIDAITNNKENSIALGSDDLSSPEATMFDFYSPSVTQKSTQKTFEAFVPKLLPRSNRKPEPIARKPDSAKPVTREPKSAKPVVEITPKPVIQITPKPVLFGFIYISEALFSREVMNSYLTCQMFALDEVSSSKLVAFDSNPVYNFSQQIPLICEEDFLFKLRENFMVVEFFEKGQSKDFLIGLAKLPLHQFYLAYRNSVIVKYLSERKLPVIGTDGWESVFNPSNGEVVGQAQILLALGTKEQIENLESERGFKKNTVKAKTPVRKKINVATQSEMEPQKDIESVHNQKTNSVVETSTNTELEVRSTSDLLDTLHKALSLENSKEKDLDSLQKAFIDNVKDHFRAHIAINSALHLPSRRKCKSKKSKARNGKHEDILPSTYVTFESFKGELKITPIVPKNTSPKWDFRCDVSLPVEYLTDNQKFLVFKVWRKSTNTTMTPNMQVDHVIGFATVDLTVLSAGLPSVQGWFNINDLSKKCNGQINIHVTPLENVMKYRARECCEGEPSSPSQPPEAPFEPGELLGRALKRKFTELDEITQRLRLRLSKVTNDESDTSNDEIADEFERDINTLCVEDDFDMVDFEKEAEKFNFHHTKDTEVGLLQTDQNLEGKQKIDHLLEKLSLISGEMSSRYVSGCSDGRYDTETLLNDLDSGSRPNLHSGVSFSREMSERFGDFDSGRSGPDGEGHSNIVKSDQHLI
ncbi:uncharacterized protein LOC123005506 [Tribolium madens]|uniref:uncharacterized protein LOC123005506 n=1 Tax=Tribolium madens TaxID=41895 RepID=UPI001CF759D7|nr:uncharacterized protein LOC123005506 [Tribolium madens]